MVAGVIVSAIINTDIVLEIGRRCVAQGIIIAGAESCTGGLIAAALTEVSGSSAWFDRCAVTYSNEAKTELLGVPKPLIDQHGAVSEAVAEAMARGAIRHQANNRLSYAVTGIAGCRTGGSAEKPVGTVCFAFVLNESLLKVETVHFAGDRTQVRERSVRHVLNRLMTF